MPNARGNREWLRDVCGPGTRPDWDKPTRTWRVARPHFRKVISALVARHGVIAVCVDIVVTRACGSWCRDARGDECDCSCLGENHGSGTWTAGWVPVSDEWVVENQLVRRWFYAGTPPQASPGPKG